MAIVCLQACTPDIPGSLPTSDGCTPLLRKYGIKRIVFVPCDFDGSSILPPTAVGTIYDNLVTAGFPGVGDPTIFVSPRGILTDLTEEDPIKVKIDDCGVSTYLNSTYSITFDFKQSWNEGAAPSAPGVQEYGEITFWDSIKTWANSYNFGVINCDDELEWILNPAGDDFATGNISVKEKFEEINDCNKIKVYEVKLTFDCGAKRQRILELNAGGNYTELAPWS